MDGAEKMCCMQPKRYLDMLNQWLILKQEGKSIAEYIRKQGWKMVAVYGMGIYGRHIIRELSDTECTVAYGIDQKADGEYKGVKILRPTVRLPEVDVVINSVIYDQNDIEENLRNVISCPLVRLEDIIYLSY